MPLLIGIAIAIAVAAFARLSGLDRDRAFYAAVLIVVGHYYVLFAAVAAAPGLPLELLGLAAFAALAVLGFRTSMWLVAAGLAIHGLFDLARPHFLAASGAPPWWPDFCMGFDIGAALLLAAILRLDPRRMSRP